MKRTSLLVCLLVASASLLVGQNVALGTITDDINPLDAHLTGTSGNTVNVTVTNMSSSAQKGTVTAVVTRGKSTHRASARVSVAAGQSINLGLILGTITDDLDPLDSISLGAVTDDPNPIG